jgi:hypothetical protein
MRSSVFVRSTLSLTAPAGAAAADDSVDSSGAELPMSTA